MSRQYNGGGRQNGNNNQNGVGSADNNSNNRRDQKNNGQNNRPYIPMPDNKKYGKLSQKAQNIEFTTKDVENYFREQAQRVDAAISATVGFEVPETKISIMSYDMSNERCPRPFVPFIMAVSTNILDDRKVYKDLPYIFRPSNDNGVHINKTYYDMLFNRFMYGKDDRKLFANPSWRKSMNIQLAFRELNEIRAYLQPKIQFPEGDTEHEDFDNAKVVVMLDPLRVFRTMTFDKTRPRDQYSADIKEAYRIDAHNFGFLISRTVEKSKKRGDNMELLKNFLASGNSGMM
jgi:hypothetical protein